MAESRASRTARGQRRVDCCRAAAALRETPETAASVRRMRARASGCSASGTDGEEGGRRRRAAGTAGARLGRGAGDGVLVGGTGSGAGECMALGGVEGARARRRRHGDKVLRSGSGSRAVDSLDRHQYRQVAELTTK